MNNYKDDNRNKGDVLAERLLDFAACIVKLINALPNNIVGKHIIKQLLRAGTSPGANYEEACGAESRADFIHKLSIVLKELKESRFWLKLVLRSELIKAEHIRPLLEECQQLCAIVAKSIITSRKRK
ncbi:MAG: four helix bundle protein [Candidatus Omnitrophota bacterium]